MIPTVLFSVLTLVKLQKIFFERAFLPLLILPPTKGMCRRDEEGREDSWDGIVYFTKKTALTLDELWNSIHGKEFASTSIKSVQSDYALNPDKVEFNRKVGGYMGAMWIHGFDDTNKFIAAQGPRNVEDFWKMIWSENVHVLVILTALIEDGWKMCTKCWPTTKDQVQSFGVFGKSL